MKICIIGQCTLHWGRMEYGNIGNYYIAKPMFEELRRVFPREIIATTMQFSSAFCEQFDLQTLPMEIYYDFARQDNLKMAQDEYDAVVNGIDNDSEYVAQIKSADLVIDFSGDIWGDNADFLGKDRFFTGLYKDLVAQQLKPTIMICGSPGPFDSCNDIKFVKRVFKGFKLVINREPVSTRLLRKQGFDLTNERDFACPSFLFQPAIIDQVKSIVGKSRLFSNDNIKVGVVLCGWNFMRGPFDAWPREDEEYKYFVEMIENIINKYHADIFLLSHSNGFAIPPAPFKMQHGRDFLIMKQLKTLLDKKGVGNHVVLFEGIYSPEITKGIISRFDVLISGRMHAAVAGLSQKIPTVIIDYGHEPKAHKLRGFAELMGMEEFIVNPNDINEMTEKTKECLENRRLIRDFLNYQILHVMKNAKEQFDYIKNFSIEEITGR